MKTLIELVGKPEDIDAWYDESKKAKALCLIFKDDWDTVYNKAWASSQVNKKKKDTGSK